RIHGYPDDYWRMTPNCLRRMLEPYGGRLTGFQGYYKFPHSVMGLAVKAPAPADFSARADALIRKDDDLLRAREVALPASTRMRRGFAQIYRSRGERYHLASYYQAEFTVDAPSPVAKAG